MWKKRKYSQTPEEIKQVNEEKEVYSTRLSGKNQTTFTNINKDLQANSLREWNRIREQFDDEVWAQEPE